MINIKTPLCKLRLVELFYLSLSTTNYSPNGQIMNLAQIWLIYKQSYTKWIYL